MDPESKKLLEETLALAEDNNKILHSMRRSMRFSRFMSLLYWLVIIGVSIGAFYYIQPYFNKVMDLYNSITNTQQKLSDSGSTVDNFLKNFQK